MENTINKHRGAIGNPIKKQRQENDRKQYTNHWETRGRHKENNIKPQENNKKHNENNR